MEKFNIAIISNVRKLRCAYRILFEQDPQSPARVVLEGPAIDSFGSPLYHLERVDLLLLDYRLVFKNTALFFALSNEYFPDIPIMLLVDRLYEYEAQRCRYHVKTLLLSDIHTDELYSLIKRTAKSFTYF